MRAVCDGFVKVPASPPPVGGGAMLEDARLDSLNVSVAAGILIHALTASAAVAASGEAGALGGGPAAAAPAPLSTSGSGDAAVAAAAQQ